MTSKMENQMQRKMEHELETSIYRYIGVSLNPNP